MKRMIITGMGVMGIFITGYSRETGTPSRAYQELKAINESMGSLGSGSTETLHSLYSLKGTMSNIDTNSATGNYPSLETIEQGILGVCVACEVKESEV